MHRLFTCVLLLCVCFATAQKVAIPAHIDSLEKKLPNAHDTAGRLAILSRLADYYQNADPVKADRYERQGLDFARETKRDSEECVFYGYIAESLIMAGNMKAGVEVCDSAIELSRKYGFKTSECTATSDVGLSYQMQGDYPRSQDYFFRALSIAESIDNKHLAAICEINISSNYFNENNSDKTIFYAQKVLETCRGLTVKVSGIQAKAYELIGSCYLQKSDAKGAEGYYFQALKLYEGDGDDNGIASMYTLLSSAYPGDYEKQLSYELKAQALWDRLGPQNLYAIANLGNLGATYGAMARRQEIGLAQKDKLFDTAEFYLIKAIGVARSVDSKQNIIYFTDSLAVIDAARGKYKAAYENLRVHNGLYDSVYSQENKNKIAALESNHEVELKSREIEINKLEIANQQKQKWFLTGGILALLIIAALIYYQSIQRKKTNTTLLLLNGELDEANKVKTKFFSILNHDLRAPVASFINYLHLQTQAPHLLDAAGKEAYAVRARKAAENLLVTMEDLLLWSKGQMENFKPSNQLVSVDELFRNFKESQEPPENIRLYFEAQPGMSLMVDEQYLKTIMYNLTSNAIKVLGSTPGSVITWRAWETGKEKYLSITDNGPGAKREAFRALYDDSAPIGIKHGLGLHIVRDLAKAIRCKLVVVSNTGTGVELKLEFS